MSASHHICMPDLSHSILLLVQECDSQCVDFSCSSSSYRSSSQPMVTDIKHVGGICIKVFPGSDARGHGTKESGTHACVMWVNARWSPLYYCSLRQISLCPLSQHPCQCAKSIVMKIHSNEVYPFLYSIPVFHSTIPFQFPNRPPKAIPFVTIMQSNPQTNQQLTGSTTGIHYHCCKQLLQRCWPFI